MIDELIYVLKKSEIFEIVFSFLKTSEIPNWFISGGFIQQIYFNFKHGFDLHTGIKDIDVVFFNQLDLSKSYERDAESVLMALLPSSLIVPDVKNQANSKFGYKMNPYRDIFEAIDSFPTTTTAIGVRGTENSLFVYAPFGLYDLDNMILRPNKKQITKKEVYEKKKNRIKKIWSKVKIIEW